jgi:hypothetical protein
LYAILVEKPEGKNHPEDISVDGRIILKRMFGKQGGKFLDWIHLAQDRDQWWAVVNTVMNLRVP